MIYAHLTQSGGPGFAILLYGVGCEKIFLCFVIKSKSIFCKCQKLFRRTLSFLKTHFQAHQYISYQQNLISKTCRHHRYTPEIPEPVPS